MMSRGATLNAVRWASPKKQMIGAGNYRGREKDDFYPTPRRGVDALLAVEKFNGGIWECACGDGAISKPFIEGGFDVVSTDLVDRGFGVAGVDFLMETSLLAPNIVTNPPFKLALPFAQKAVDLGAEKVAMLFKLAFLEGVERGEWLEHSPLSRVFVFKRRLSFVNGETSSKIDGGGMMAFAWFIWEHGHEGPPTLGWI